MKLSTYETFLGSLIDRFARKYGQVPSPFFHHCGRAYEAFYAAVKEFGRYR